MTLETPRLRLTPVTLDDLPFFHTLWRDPEVMTHLGGVHEPERIAPLLSDAVQQWRSESLGRWVVRLGPRPIGTVKLAPVILRGRGETEIGYALMPSHSGHGYATEAAERVLGLAFQERSIPSVVALVLDGNEHSLAVVERLGFGREALIQRPQGQHVLLRLSR